MKELLDKAEQEFREQFYIPNYPNGFAVKSDISAIQKFLRTSITEATRAALEEIRLAQNHKGAEYQSKSEILRQLSKVDLQHYRNGYNQAKADLDEKINAYINGHK